MDYNDIDDVELITLLEENDENVRNIIYDKYSYLVDILIKKYQRVFCFAPSIPFSTLRDILLWNRRTSVRRRAGTILPSFRPRKPIFGSWSFLRLKKE